MFNIFHSDCMNICSAESLLLQLIRIYPLEMPPPQPPQGCPTLWGCFIHINVCLHHSMY